MLAGALNQTRKNSLLFQILCQPPKNHHLWSLASAKKIIWHSQSTISRIFFLFCFVIVQQRPVGLQTFLCTLLVLPQWSNASIAREERRMFSCTTMISGEEDRTVRREREKLALADYTQYKYLWRDASMERQKFIRSLRRPVNLRRHYRDSVPERE